MKKVKARPETKTIGDRVRFLADGWAYKQLVQKHEELRRDPTDEKTGLVIEAYKLVHKLVSAEIRYHLEDLRNSGQLAGIVIND